MLRAGDALRLFNRRASKGSIAIHQGFIVTTIVNYGAGNIRSVENTLAELGGQYEVTDQPAVVLRATKIILPGVGHFGQMMQVIDKLSLRQPLRETIAS